jgi:hypothetical protein
MSERYAILFSAGGGAILIALLAWLAPSHILTSGIVTFFLLLISFLVGSLLYPQGNHGSRFLVGLLGCISLQSILQTAWYYAAPTLTPTAYTLCTSISLLIIGATGFFLSSRKDVSDEARDALPKPHVLWLAVSLFVVLIPVLFVLWHAWQNGTSESIRTPWPLLPAGTLGAIGCAALGVWLSAWKSRSRPWTAFLCALALAAPLFIAPLLYQVGYGFDGFLHRASEELLLTTGTLTPKPFYYIGQYTVTLWLAQLLHLPHATIDTWLVPITALLFPLLLGLLLFRNRLRAFDIAALTILLPLAPFIATTPQSFAYLIGLFACLFALASKDAPRLSFVALALGIWALIIHPIAGLPFFGAAVLIRLSLFLHQKNSAPLRSPFTWAALLLTALAVPVGFFLNGLVSQANIEWRITSLFRWETISHLFQAWQPPSIHLALWPDFAHFFSYIFPLLLLLFAFLASLRRSSERAIWQPLLVLGLLMHAAGLFLRLSGEFTFLIDYERGNYAERLFLVGQLFWLLPALAFFGEWMGTHIKKNPVLVGASLLFFLSFSGAQAYLALPRHDATVVGHGWSVGQVDREAVRWVEQDARKQPYAVLANQSVSAAAVEAFGFRRYATSSPTEAEPIFYYPIPTGGPLYQTFLQMTSQPSRDLAQEAARMADASIVYVILNDYWWDAERVAETLESIADKTVSLRDGAVRIYTFEVTKASNR